MKYGRGIVAKCHKEWASKVHIRGGKSKTSKEATKTVRVTYTAAYCTWGVFLQYHKHHIIVQRPVIKPEYKENELQLFQWGAGEKNAILFTQLLEKLDTSWLLIILFFILSYGLWVFLAFYSNICLVWNNFLDEHTYQK